MPTRVVGIFSAEENADLAQVLLFAVGELLAVGHRLRLVDADLGGAVLSRLTDSLGRGDSTDLLGLLRQDQQRARGVDVSEALRIRPSPPRSYVDLVPALPAGQEPDLALCAQPPLHGSRAYAFLKDRLGDSSADLDLVLLLAPPGSGALARALLAHGVDGAVFVATGEAAQVEELSNLALEAEALRGTPLPMLCVEGRDGREANLARAWRRFWRAPADGGPRVLVLDRDGSEAEWGLQMRRMVGVHEPDPGERVREAEAEGWPEVAAEAFAALWARDPAQALALFDAEIAPRQGTRMAAVAATRAVWADPEAPLEARRRVAVYTLQKLRLEDPTPDSELLVDCCEALVHAAQADPSTRDPARLYISLAEALLHQAAWRQVTGEPIDGLAERAESLLREAAGMPRRPADRARSALAWGRHARITGSAQHYSHALNEMIGLTDTLGRVVAFQKVIDVVGYFARVEPSYWAKVELLAKEIEEQDPRYAHFSLAVAYAHLGRRREALEHLWLVGRVDYASYELAWSDPDLTPLFAGAGRSDYAYDPPDKPRYKLKTRKR